MLGKHWGEISECTPRERKSVKKLEQLTYCGSVEEEKLFQPSSTLSAKGPPKVIEVRTEPVVLHTINLLQYNRVIRTLLAKQKEMIQKRGASEHRIPSPPPMPELPECIMKYRRPGDATYSSKFRHFKQENVLLNISGHAVHESQSERDHHASQSQRDHSINSILNTVRSTPPISATVAHQILRKSIGVLCAHAGFQTAHESVLQTFTDIAQDFLVRICGALRRNVDREALTGCLAFIDALEQTFHDTGLGSILNIHHFYQTRIVGYHEHVLSSCEKLLNEYKKLRNPTETLDEEKTEESTKKYTNEIHFPVIEEAEESQPEATQIPFQLEFQGDVRNLESESSARLKDENPVKWPMQNTKKDGVALTLQDTEPDIPMSPASGKDDLTHTMIGATAISESDSCGIDNDALVDPSIHGPPSKKKMKI